VRETTLQTPKSVKEGGRGAESLPLQPMMKDRGEANCPPAVRGGPWWSRSPPVAHGMDPTLEQVDA